MDISLSSEGAKAHEDERPFLGQILFKEIWEGESNAVRSWLLSRFGDSLCSRYASGGRRPDGDSRAVIEEITRRGGIPIRSSWWSWRVEVMS